MKKSIILLLLLSLLISTGCASKPAVSVQVAADTPQEAVDLLAEGNRRYMDSAVNPADISTERRAHTANNGQSPYAVVITCADSRVPPEHIFTAGVGDLFVVRTAGNVIGDFELGSIEYGVEHLGAKVVVVMGHTQCGAVSAALEGHADGHIRLIVDEILVAIQDEQDSEAAEDLNIAHAERKIMQSEIVAHLVDEERVQIAGAKYDISTGEVIFL